MISPSELEHIHQLIQGVKFVCSSFQESLSRLHHVDAVSIGYPLWGQEDFIYLDPPYVPENPKSFVKYTHDGFSLETIGKRLPIVPSGKIFVVIPVLCGQVKTRSLSLTRSPVFRLSASLNVRIASPDTKS